MGEVSLEAFEDLRQLRRFGSNDDEKVFQPAPAIVKFRARCATSLCKFQANHDELKVSFAAELDAPFEALCRKVTPGTVKAILVNENNEILSLGLLVLPVVSNMVTEDTLSECTEILTTLAEIARKHYALLKISDQHDTWKGYAQQILSRFSTVQRWTEAHPIKAKVAGAVCVVGGTFAIGGGLASLFAHLLPTAICAVGGPIFWIGGLIAVGIGACGMGVFYYLRKQRLAKENFQGALFKMIRDLTERVENEGSVPLQSLTNMLKATRNAADQKWKGIMSPQDLDLVRENLGDCAICLQPLGIDEDLVLPITGNRGCNHHCFHAHCLPPTGKCPLDRSPYLSVRPVPKQLWL